VRVVSLLLSALFLVACSVPATPVSPSTTWTPPPTPEPPVLPVAVTAPQPESIDGPEFDRRLGPLPENASLADEFLRRVQRETVTAVGLWGEIGGHCDPVVRRKGTTTNCWVTYNSVAVPWHVTIIEEPSYTVRFMTKPLKGLLVAKAVHARLWQEFGGRYDDLRCAAIPEITVVALPTETGYHCQYREPQQDGSSRRTNVVVRVDDNGKVNL
jgi:hypothetical protein